MTCDHCVSAVTEELSALDGVQGVAVDLNASGVSRVDVTVNRPLDSAAVEVAITEAGYSIGGGLIARPRLQKHLFTYLVCGEMLLKG
ncbi:copper chaperone [Labedella phragmitis]|uniref:Copper chaperone n=1 Tax=Labedella phragmitis TaxID=2498849 RepID=A0A3S4BLT1_9MICO|nr:heavy-metal-associated domain-containing protein [Labedella phragmitis]RWZ52909.1 copper chaperone [Labedella phragmitis]